MYLTWPHIVPVLLVLGVGAGLPVLLGRSRQCRPTLILAAVPIVIVGPVAVARTETAGLHRNPVVAMVASLLPRVDARVVVGDWRKPPFEAHDADDFSHLRGLVAGRNVVLVGLESTAAKHLRLYGASRDLTPHLDRLAEHAVIFERAYAVTPDSIRGLFSVLCSRYPAFDVPTDAYADVPCASMSETLRLAGYRTGLFHSGRFDYLGMNAVIRGRGFETLEDAADIGGQRESSFGVEEPATVARMLDWIDGLGGDEPFLLTYLPIAGHHPYEVAERGPFPDHDDQGRHRNAVHHGDKSLGALIDGLRARGLYDRTLWIVYGDHGQAFGDHPGNYGHTFFLYEENVRVPLIVALPGVIDRPRRSRTTASLVDIAPTLFDLLSIPHTEQHQGKSVLHPAARMALFFTDYSLSLVGLRDGRWKFIADLATGQSKLFDLESDPDERMTLSASYPERIARYEKTLRSWSAAQKADVTGDCPKFERPFTPAGSGRWHQRAGDRCRSIPRRR
jgi:phosphoglycerol transferase MdoB-like AlkP superfamily enzyme